MFWSLHVLITSCSDQLTNVEPEHLNQLSKVGNSLIKLQSELSWIGTPLLNSRAFNQLSKGGSSWYLTLAAPSPPHTQTREGGRNTMYISTFFVPWQASYPSKTKALEPRQVCSWAVLLDISKKLGIWAIRGTGACKVLWSFLLLVVQRVVLILCKQDDGIIKAWGSRLLLVEQRVVFK
jgi:hypothetical protein